MEAGTHGLVREQASGRTTQFNPGRARDCWNGWAGGKFLTIRFRKLEEEFTLTQTGGPD